MIKEIMSFFSKHFKLLLTFFLKNKIEFSVLLILTPMIWTVISYFVVQNVFLISYTLGCSIIVYGVSHKLVTHITVSNTIKNLTSSELEILTHCVEQDSVSTLAIITKSGDHSSLRYKGVLYQSSTLSDGSTIQFNVTPNYFKYLKKKYAK